MESGNEIFLRKGGRIGILFAVMVSGWECVEGRMMDGKNIDCNRGAYGGGRACLALARQTAAGTVARRYRDSARQLSTLPADHHLHCRQPAVVAAAAVVSQIREWSLFSCQECVGLLVFWELFPLSGEWSVQRNQITKLHYYTALHNNK